MEAYLENSEKGRVRDWNGMRGFWTTMLLWQMLPFCFIFFQISYQHMKNTFISGMSLLVFKSSYLSCKSHARAPAVSKIRRRVVESSHGSRASCQGLEIRSKSSQKSDKKPAKQNPFFLMILFDWNVKMPIRPLYIENKNLA